MNDDKGQMFTQSTAFHFNKMHAALDDQKNQLEQLAQFSILNGQSIVQIERRMGRFEILAYCTFTILGAYFAYKFFYAPKSKKRNKSKDNQQN